MTIKENFGEGDNNHSVNAYPNRTNQKSIIHALYSFLPCLGFYPMVSHMVKVFNEAMLPDDNEVHKEKMIPKSNSKSHFT